MSKTTITNPTLSGLTLLNYDSANLVDIFSKVYYVNEANEFNTIPVLDNELTMVDIYNKMQLYLLKNEEVITVTIPNLNMKIKTKNNIFNIIQTAQSYIARNTPNDIVVGAYLLNYAMQYITSLANNNFVVNDIYLVVLPKKIELFYPKLNKKVILFHIKQISEDSDEHIIIELNTIRELFKVDSLKTLLPFIANMITYLLATYEVVTYKILFPVPDIVDPNKKYDIVMSNLKKGNIPATIKAKIGGVRKYLLSSRYVSSLNVFKINYYYNSNLRTQLTKKIVNDDKFLTLYNYNLSVKNSRYFDIYKNIWNDLMEKINNKVTTAVVEILKLYIKYLDNKQK